MSDEFEQVVLGAAPREWFDPRDGSPIIPDSWRPVLTAVEKYTADLRATIARLTAERDSLAASLEEAREERDKLAAEAEAFRTGMGNGVTILPTEWLDKERAELSELRARVEEAVAWFRGLFPPADETANEYLDDLLAILSPLEGP